ncbi:MAG: hypothetical protein GXP49_03810 [Deltaproteobacteria bacterium]|nr:hypothetical protein [Deltaproteobacteria bacterium]
MGTQVTFQNLPLKALLEALETLATDAEGKYVYNLVFNEVDGTRIEKDKYWVAIENGKATWGEGHKDDPEATSFTIKRGGVDTVLAMQVRGLDAAKNCMILGYITTSSIKKSEAWFKVLEIGEKPLVEALAKAGYEVTDTSLPILKSLMLT